MQKRNNNSNHNRGGNYNKKNGKKKSKVLATMIPLAGNIKRNKWDINKKGQYSGYIDYSLTTKTPLFIPNTSNENILNIVCEEHNSYAFFSYEDLNGSLKNKEEIKKILPIISGSEVRGMFRAYYELITNSCISQISESFIRVEKVGKNKKDVTVKVDKMLGEYDNKKCNEEGVCKACELFGTVNSNFQIPSRLRFTDLRPDKTNGLFEDVCHLKPLATPKMKSDVSQIGRKFYKHNLNISNKDYADKDIKKLGCTIVPVKKDIKFSGKVYFDSLTSKELDYLVFLISCGYDENNSGYKLGRGKNLGLGSVACKINDIKIKTLKKGDSISIEEESYKYNKEHFDDKIFKSFKSITSFCYKENSSSVNTNI